MAVLSTPACTEGLTAKSGGETAPQVLTLALPEGRQVPYAPAVERFADAVHERTDGELVIELDWGHERRLLLDSEESLIAAVRNGEADLAHVPARAFDRVGVDRFRALQDPLTLDTIEKADAVAAGDVAHRMLRGLRADGLVGLGMYAENLRRPVGYREAMTHADDFVGRTLRVQPSSMSYQTLQALGARPSMSSTYTSTADGMRYDGAESTWHSWAGRHPFPTGARITGDLVLFPKFNVFIADPEVFDALDEVGQEALTLAARDTMRYWVEDYRPSEEELAEAWCTGGRRLVIAGAAGVESVRAALRPLARDLEARAEVAEDLRAVRRIAAEHPGSFEPPALCLPPTGDGVWLDE